MKSQKSRLIFCSVKSALVRKTAKKILPPSAANSAAKKTTPPSAAKRSEKRPCFGTSSTFKGLHPTRANQPRKVLPKPPVCAAGGGADGKATWQLPKHSLHHIHAMPVPSAHSSKQARPQTAVQCNVFLVFSLTYCLWMKSAFSPKLLPIVPKVISPSDPSQEW